MGPGKRLGSYEFLRRLGKGGMGEVWLARDLRLGREVALKVLPAEFATDPSRRRRLEDEARAVAALNHPNLVTLFAIESADSIEFLTMEYVEGETLESSIPPGGMSPERFLSIARPMAEAMAAAHGRGVTHRDLKPGNVMIDRGGRVKVLDFGIALRDDAEVAGGGADSATRTADGIFVGTIAYAAPERLAGRPSGPASDVFSLGVIFHEMLAGIRPFSGSTPAEIASSILRDEPPPLAVPEALARVVRACLAKTPSSRYPTGKELAADLAALGPLPSVPRPAVATIPRSVAVATFVDPSGDPESTWLGVGLADHVSLELRRVKGLSVIGRDRVASAARRAGDTPAILAPALGACWVVSGTYRRLGTSLRVEVSVHSAAAGKEVGASIVDGSVDDLFAMQDRLLEKVVSILDADATGETLAPGTGPRASASDAFELYARSRELVLRMDPNEFPRAAELLRGALEADPDWALPRAGLGQLHAMRFIATTDRTDLEEAVRLLEAAAAADPELPEPLSWLTYAFWRLDRFDDAERAGARAVSLDPNDPLPHYFLGACLLGKADVTGDPTAVPRAEASLDRAARLAPGYQAGHQLLACARQRRGRYEEALLAVERAAEIEASGEFDLARFVGAHAQLAVVRLRLGDLEGAIEAADRSAAHVPPDSHVYGPTVGAAAHRVAAEALLRSGRPGDAAARLARLKGLVESHPRGLGLGWLAVRGEIATAWTYRKLGVRAEERKAAERARSMLAERAGYDFGWYWDGTEAECAFDFALYLAATGRPEEAIDRLRAAVSLGWAELRRLSEDPILAPLRGRREFEALLGGEVG